MKLIVILKTPDSKMHAFVEVVGASFLHVIYSGLGVLER